jgi:signal transduction histidine kinase
MDEYMREIPPCETNERLLVCGDAEFCAEVQHELERREQHLSITTVTGCAGAREALERQLPAVILVDERALWRGPAHREGKAGVQAEVSSLVRYAPVVLVGNAKNPGELSALYSVGAADYVPRSPLCLQAAVTMVERRLRQGRAKMPGPSKGLPVRAEEIRNGDSEHRDFGEVLRHELNNPLTGILGNAELLLVELRRHTSALPEQTERRLETIAALAVRMRETVRQLSDAWEAQAAEITCERAERPN